MHKDHVELLIKRAKNFLEIAKDRLNKKDWDLTCFNIEQAVQLYLKATILEISGELPRIHSIRQLVSIFLRLTKQEVKWDRKSLILLESAYFNSRYLSFSYEKEDAEEALRIGKELIAFVEDFRGRKGKI